MLADSTSMIRRVVVILDCFTADQPKLGVREVARLTGLSASTAGRIMAELKDLGILQQNSATRTYSLGSKILAWSGVYMDSLDMRTLALPLMEELRRSTFETISLYIMDGYERLCVERMESHQNVRMTSRVGHRLPLYAGSAGKAIMAFLSDEKIIEILQHTDLKPFTTQTITDPEAILAELHQIRQRGYSISMGEWISEASGVAAPILRQGAEVVGAISISGPRARFEPEKVLQYGKEIVRAAGQLSHMMGFIPFIGLVE
jgi:IclR family transcriptional regulator, KDG regulon repressor